MEPKLIVNREQCCDCDNLRAQLAAVKRVRDEALREVDTMHNKSRVQYEIRDATARDNAALAAQLVVEREKVAKLVKAGRRLLKELDTLQILGVSAEAYYEMEDAITASEEHANG